LADYPVYENGVGKTYSPEAFRQHVLPRLRPQGEEGPVVRRGIWAPELNWLPRQKQYLLSFCLNTNLAVPPAQWTAHGCFGGNYFLKSKSGLPVGPWELLSEHPATDMIDGTVFEDDDGSAWFVWQDGRMARFEKQLRYFDAIRDPWQIQWKPEPNREGPFVVKRDGRYHLFVTIASQRFEDGTTRYAHEHHTTPQSYSYDLLVASSDRLTGPYGPRSLCALGGGHGHPLLDKEGKWWLAAFGNPHYAHQPFAEPCRPYLIPMQWVGDRFLPKQTRESHSIL
jgi:hypothetical protein